MAPEQARGLAVDQRADIYAFGMIVSEMLIGRRPVPDGLTPIEAFQRRIEEAPASLRVTDAAIPQALDDDRAAVPAARPGEALRDDRRTGRRPRPAGRQRRADSAGAPADAAA